MLWLLNICLASLVGKGIKNGHLITLPPTYIKLYKRKGKLIPQDEPAINEIEYGLQTSHFLKGLESKHTAYYFEEIPIPFPIKGLQENVEKIPTMVQKGKGLSGAILYRLPPKKFIQEIGISTNRAFENHTFHHIKKNNNFLSMGISFENDGGWFSIPARYRASNIKDQLQSLTGTFQTGYQDAEQKLTLSSINQYRSSNYDDLFGCPFSNQQESQQNFNLWGLAYQRHNWKAFSSLHSNRLSSGKTTEIFTWVSGVNYETEKKHGGFFAEQINHQKVYRYDVYGGYKIGKILPTVRLIKTEAQILLPYEVQFELSKFMKIIMGKTYHLPDQYQRFDPQYGKFNLKPEQNYHCHIIHNWANKSWSLQNILFINTVQNLIDFSFVRGYENRGKLNSIGVDQAVSYEGFERYKIGCAHTYCILDSTEPLVSRPAWKLLVWQRFHLKENLCLDFDIHYISAYHDRERNNYEKIKKNPAVLLFTTKATYQVNKNLDIVWEAKNLTNKYHENPRGYIAKGLEVWLRFIYKVD